MPGKLFRISIAFLFFALGIFPVLSQPTVCKPAAFAARRPIPKLAYDCNEDLDDSDDEVLADKKRRKALALYVKTLEKLTHAEWWKTSVEDLNVCDFRRKTGALSDKEKEEYEGGSYFFNLLGNNRLRVVVAPDPCYQTAFGGSNMFLLNRVGGRVFASQIIDGFYTRSDYSPEVDFALDGAEQIIEIATTSGGLNPSMTSYFFAIDAKTNRAVPKNLFRSEEGKMTNRITSKMLLDEPEEYGLPPKVEALDIIQNGRLAKSFDVFEDTGETFGESNQRKFARQTLRWNGKFYE